MNGTALVCMWPRVLSSLVVQRADLVTTATDIGCITCIGDDQDTISSFIISSSAGWSGLVLCPRPLEDSWSLSLNLDLHSCTKIFSRIVQGSKCKPVSVYTPTFLRLVNFTGNSSHEAGYSKEKSYPRVSTGKGRTGRFSQSSVEMSNDPARKHSGV